MRLTRRPLSCGVAGDADAEVDGVGHEALFARLQRFEQALACERVAVDERHASTIERQAGCVREPHRAQWLRPPLA